MSFSAIASAILPWLLVILVAFLVWAVIELALSFRRVRTTLDEVDETIKKADPLIEHATLTVDAVNLEIMRVDQILEDVESMTDTASNAVDAVDTVVNAPKEIATSVADFLRGSAKERGRKRAAERTLASEKASLGEPTSAGDATDCDEKASGITIIESPIASKEDSEAAADTATTEDTPKDDTDVA